MEAPGQTMIATMADCLVCRRVVHKLGLVLSILWMSSGSTNGNPMDCCLHSSTNECLEVAKGAGCPTHVYNKKHHTSFSPRVSPPSLPAPQSRSSPRGTYYSYYWLWSAQTDTTATVVVHYR